MQKGKIKIISNGRKNTINLLVFVHFQVGRHKISAIKSHVFGKSVLYFALVWWFLRLATSWKYIALFKFPICFGLDLFILQQYCNEFLVFFILLLMRQQLFPTVKARWLRFWVWCSVRHLNAENEQERRWIILFQVS